MSFSQRYLGMIVLGAIALGFFWDEFGQSFRPFLIPMLMLIMILSSLKIDPRDLWSVKKDFWRYLVLFLFIFILPTFIISLFRGILDDEIYVGLILAAAVPSAISSVFLSDLLKGDPSKALVATTFAHLVSPLFTPLLVWIFAHTVIEVNVNSMMKFIAELVLIPFFSAQILKRWKGHQRILPHVSTTNTLLLFLIIWGVIAQARDLVLTFWREAILTLGIVLFVLAVGTLVSILFGRTKKEDITFTILDTYKNFAMSSVIAASLFGPLAILGSVAYSIGDNLLLLPLQWWGNRRRQPNR